MPGQASSGVGHGSPSPEVGDLFPRAGTLVVQTASGHRISAFFSSGSVLTGNVRVVIDAHDAVPIPIPAV